MNSRIWTLGRQDSFFLPSLLKRPYNVTLQPCSTVAGAVPSANERKKKSNDGNMPLLPVQPLDQMLQTYLKSIKPFVDAAQFEKTKALVDSFCKDENLGGKLQKLLQDRASKTENWLSEWWLDSAYLEYRNPVVVYSSPALVWPKLAFQNQNHQLSYAAHLIASALNFNLMIEKNEIEQEKIGEKHRLCMSQYSKIFGTCRIPKIPKDELKFQDPNNPSNNIIIMYNNYLFSIPAYKNKKREPFEPETYYTWLSYIVQIGEGNPGPAVGVLTTENRDNWAKSYEKLKEIPENKEILENYVEKALFTVCIDKPLTLGGGLTYDTRCSKLLLHGFGYRGNAGNRWYDKTIQFVLGAEKDGRGIVYEHSPAEGGVIGVLTDHIHKEINSLGSKIFNLSNQSFTSKNKIDIKKLDFVLSDSLLQDIETAGKAVDRLNDELDVSTWTFKGFGKDKLKSFGISPDSFIQIAIQLAFFNLHNRPGAQYESGTLRKYLYGRTDTIRSCTEEVVQFCHIMSQPQQNFDSKILALKRALQAHKSYVECVMDGRGVDRHMLALRLLAKMNNIEDPFIFNDIAYKKSTYFYLSTSNVPSKCNAVMVYGPLVEDGYACCYNPRSESINFGMSAWASCRATRLNGFEEEVKNALFNMENLLSSSFLISKL